MNKLSSLTISRNKNLNEIFIKAHRQRIIGIETCLYENSLAFLLLEEIDQSDISEVSKSIESASKQIKDIFSYFDKLENFDRGKILTLETYLESLEDALETAKKELATVSMDQGAISSFFGAKLTLPRIAQASIAIQTKANDFAVGFSKAITNIQKNLGPLIEKAADKETSIRDAAGQGSVPEIGALEKGIKEAMKKALGGGFFKKVMNFFGKTTSMGAEKKILGTIPDLDVNIIADEVAEAILDSSLSSFEAAQAPDVAVNSGNLESVAKDAQDAVESASEAEKSGEEPTAPGAETEKEATKEQEEAQEELRDAIQDEKGESQTPAEAAHGAIDSWADGLSPTSQKQLTTKNRLGDLKAAINVALDDVSKSVEGEVSSAIQAWRDQHEETLIKSRRFAKKNFDTLQSLVPQLTSFMVKKSNESKLRTTKSSIEKVVFELLNRKFYKNYDKLLFEQEKRNMYSEEEMLIYRMNKLAGIDK